MIYDLYIQWHPIGGKMIFSLSASILQLTSWLGQGCVHTSPYSTWNFLLAWAFTCFVLAVRGLWDHWKSAVISRNYLFFEFMGYLWLSQSLLSLFCIDPWALLGQVWYRKSFMADHSKASCSWHVAQLWFLY